MLYNLPSSDFHDVTTGNNGNPAGPGYDLVTGLGSPIVNKVAYGLMGTASLSGTVFQDNNSNGVKGRQTTDRGSDRLSGFEQQRSIGYRHDYTRERRLRPHSRSLYLRLQSTLTVGGTSSTVSNVSVTLNIAHPRDSDLIAYLMTPGRQIEFFSNIGARGRTLPIPLSATGRRDYRGGRPV